MMLNLIHKLNVFIQTISIRNYSKKSNADKDIKTPKPRGRPKKELIKDPKEGCKETKGLTEAKPRGRPKKITVIEPDTKVSNTVKPSELSSKPLEESIKPVISDYKQFIMVTKDFILIDYNEVKPLSLLETSLVLYSKNRYSLILYHSIIRSLKVVSVEVLLWDILGFANYEIFGGLIKLSDLAFIRSFVYLNKKEVSRINENGFINSSNLYMDSSYNVIKGILLKYVGIDVKFGKIFGEKFGHLEQGKIFKWVYNMFILSLYVLLGKSVIIADKLLKDVLSIQTKRDLTSDEISLLKGLEEELSLQNALLKELYNRLDSSLRYSLKRKGMSFIENRYTGFDTEYVNKEISVNKLVSVQLSVNTRTLLKVPSVLEYKYTKVTALTGKFIELSDYHEHFDSLSYLSDMNRLISDYREFKFGDSDKILKRLILSLQVKGVPYIEKDGYIIFDFGRTPVRQWIRGVQDNVEVRLVDIIRQSNKMSDDALSSEYKRIVDYIIKAYKTYNCQVTEVKGNNFDNMTPMSEYTRVVSVSEEFTGFDNIYDVRSDKNFLEELSEINRLNKMLEVTEDSVENADNADEINLEEVNESDLTPSMSEKELLIEEEDEIRRSYLRTKFSVRGNAFSSTRKRNNYLIGHLNSADISLLSDYEEFKEEIGIIGKSFVSIGRPLNIDGVKVYLRDTILLSPAGSQSLKAIGKMHGSFFEKVELSQSIISRMDKLAKYDWELFKTYALQDSLITLAHAIFMEDYNFRIGNVGVPLTVSSLSASFVDYYWGLMKYKGYQISPEYLIGDASKMITPKGLGSVGLVAEKLPLYIENYKGGRNESFCYGVDRDTVWYDYDLIGAYTTVMCLLGNPLYSSARVLSKDKFKELYKKDPKSLLYSYTVIKCSFKFPDGVKYPSIPVQSDETTTIYPLNGEAVLTMAEYITAKRQGCIIVEKEIFQIPFELLESKDHDKDVVNKEKDALVGKEEEVGLIKTFDVPNPPSPSNYLDARLLEVSKASLGTYSKMFLNLPFRDLVFYLQNERMKYPKKTMFNELYKLLGNSTYGLVVKGISGKGKLDTKTNSMQRLSSGYLSNPIIASWITGFVRSILGELLHYTHRLGGKVVSVTTDGFITDIEDLENKINNLIEEDNAKAIEDINSVSRAFYKDMISTGWELPGERGALPEIDRNLDAKAYLKKALEAREAYWASRYEVTEAPVVFLTKEYQATRSSITGSDIKETSCLELKQKGKGIISWSVRGQLGIESKISAITGFQKKGIDHNDLVNMLINAINTSEKTINFVHKTLRGGAEIYRKGGHVTPTYRDQKFRVMFDNRRRVIIPDNVIIKDDLINYDNQLLDSDPLKDRKEAIALRSVSSILKASSYNKHSSISNSTIYKTNIEIALRSFIRCLYSNKLGLDSKKFQYYRDLLQWYSEFKVPNKPRLNVNMISLIRTRGGFVPNVVPKTEETLLFSDFIKEKFPEFDESGWFVK